MLAPSHEDISQVLSWKKKTHYSRLTVQPAPSSDVAGVEVGQHSFSRRDTSQLHMVRQRHRLRQLDQGNIITARKTKESET